MRSPGVFPFARTSWVLLLRVPFHLTLLLRLTLTLPPPTLACSGLRGIRLGTVPSYLLNVPELPYPSSAGLPPARRAAPRLVSRSAAGVPVVSRQDAFTAQLPARSFLQAALTLPAPATPVCKILKPLSPSKGCFRCLTPDHLVQDCRDPVRCRRCRGYGHRSPECKMPLSRLFRACTRR